MTEERVRRRWPPLLWAIVALPLWASITLLPAVVVGLATGTQNPPAWWLLPGMLFATPLMLRIDQRVGPVSPPALWVPPVGWWSAAAFLAGCGVVILASEVGNILLSTREFVPLGSGEPGPTLTPWETAGLALVNGVCLVGVLQGVVQRALTVRWPRKWALVGTVALGAIFGGGGFAFQFALLLILPVWLFAQTRSLLPSMMALLPHAVPALLEASGLSPGVPGFDLVRADEVLWQPVWFNLLGAGLLAAGMAPLLRALGDEAK